MNTKNSIDTPEFREAAAQYRIAHLATSRAAYARLVAVADSHVAAECANAQATMTNHVTAEQLAAGCDMLRQCGNNATEQDARLCFEAMIGASPASPQAGVPEPVTWMRKWAADGEKPAKVKKENGRWAWPKKFKFLPVTVHKIFPDDVPLYLAAPQPPAAESRAQAAGVDEPPQEFTDYVKANYSGIVDFYSAEWHAKRLWRAATRAAKPTIVGYVNGNELDNMLDDRTAVIQGVPSNDRRVPLYRAALAAHPTKDE